MSPRLKTFRNVLWTLIAVLCVTSLWVLLSPSPPKKKAIGGIGAPFTLTTQEGATFSTVQLRNKPYALFFGFTHCPDICPTSLFELSNLLKEVGAAAKDFNILFVSVDPTRDTPQLLKTYLSSFDPRIIGLTGSEDDVAAVIKSHKAYARKVPTSSGYTMDHTASVYLFDKNQQFVSTLDVQEAKEAQKAKLLRLLSN